MAVVTYIDDDGSTITYDDLTGDVFGSTPYDYAVVPPGSEVSYQAQIQGAFGSLLSRAVDKLLPAKPVTTSVYRQSAPAFNAQALIGPALLVGGAFFAFKLFKG